MELYVNTIRKEVLANDQSRPFLVSSPTNGLQSEKDGYVAGNPQSEFYGDGKLKIGIIHRRVIREFFNYFSSLLQLFIGSVGSRFLSDQSIFIGIRTTILSIAQDHDDGDQ